MLHRNFDLQCVCGTTCSLHHHTYGNCYSVLRIVNYKHAPFDPTALNFVECKHANFVDKIRVAQGVSISSSWKQDHTCLLNPPGSQLLTPASLQPSPSYFPKFKGNEAAGPGRWIYLVAEGVQLEPATNGLST